MARNRIWIIAGTAAVLLLICFFTVQHLLNADTWRGKIETSLSDSLGRPVHLGHLSFSLLSGNLEAETLVIDDDPAFSTQPFLTAHDIRIGVQVAPLVIHHQLQVDGLTIDQPKITLLRGQNGVWNYSSLGSKGKKKAAQADSPLPNLTVSKFAIRDGEISVGTVPQAAPPHVYTGLAVDAQGFSLTKSFPFSVSGELPGNGKLQISGNAGPLNENDASLTPVSAQISLKHADLAAAGLVDARQDIAGIADLEAKVNTNGDLATATGNLHVTQLKLAKNGTASTSAVDLQFALSQNLRALSGKIDTATLRVGTAALAIGGTYQTQGNTTTTQLVVSGANVPVNDVEAFLPTLGIQLPAGAKLQGGAITTSLNFSGPVTSPVITGPVRIANTQIAGFDLGQKLSAISALTGAHTGSTTTIQALSTNLHYGADGTQLNDLAVVVASLGSASGTGFVTPTGGLNFHLTVKLDPSGTGGVATQAMSMLPGIFGSAISQVTKGGIPVTIAGTTSNPTFTPDMSRMASGIVQQQKGKQSNPLGNVLGGLLQHP